MTPQARVEARLAALRDRRRALERSLERLDRELGAAILRGRAVRMPMGEIAQRAGVTRATLYRCLERTEGSK